MSGKQLLYNHVHVKCTGLLRYFSGNSEMCLGIPMKVVEIDDFVARCEAKGVMRDISLFILQHENIEPGDYVVVHTGYAIQKMTEHEARSAWEIYDEMLDLEAEQHEIGITSDA